MSERKATAARGEFVILLLRLFSYLPLSKDDERCLLRAFTHLRVRTAQMNNSSYLCIFSF